MKFSRGWRFYTLIEAEQNSPNDLPIICNEVGLLKDRKSKDGLVNVKGRKFIMSPVTFNMFTLTDRYREDESGVFTVFNEKEASVIDFCCAGLGGLKCVKSFYLQVGCFLQNMPLVISLQMPLQDGYDVLSLELRLN